MPDNRPRRVWLTMPGYDNLTAPAARAFWNASKGVRARIPLQVDATWSGGSLLAQNFNGLWCGALNQCHHDNPVDYFAMLHSDVEPDDGWLDTLIEELEARQLDVLGAVVPIKDPTGVTSIALDRGGGDTWKPLCRLTMREVYDLPETFTSEDCGHPLLLNTGCWVCKFDMKWARKVHFTINDRIVFNTSLNLYQAQVEPEDWFFSRLCHELKLKLGATRKLGLDHAGPTRYTNRQPWGQHHFDARYVPASVLPDLNPPGWKFPEDVDGWLLPSEGRALAELARGKRVLEIGSYCGRSTICMAQTAEQVVSVDPHDGRGTPKPRDTFWELKQNLARYGAHNVSTLRGTLQESLHAYSLAQDFDLIFIDGAHDLESVRADIKSAIYHLTPGGLLAFHDYRTKPGQHDGGWDAGVTQAVDELITEGGGELIATYSTVAVVKPPVLSPLLENCNAHV